MRALGVFFVVQTDKASRLYVWTRNRNQLALTQQKNSSKLLVF